MNHIDLFSGIGGFAYAAKQVWGDGDMIIKIKLKNSKYCNGCPCTTGNVLCRLYEILTLETDLSGLYTLRPEICKKENGIV